MQIDSDIENYCFTYLIIPPAPKKFRRSTVIGKLLPLIGMTLVLYWLEYTYILNVDRRYCSFIFFFSLR